MQLPPAQIEAFGVEFHRLSAAADRWDVWGAAYLIGGGCSDDAFVDFRSGLIAAGREWYDRALADPDSLAAHPAVAEAAEWDDDSAIFAELVGYAGFQAYRQVTGVEWAIEMPEGETCGQRWDFDDDDEMRRRSQAERPVRRLAGQRGLPLLSPQRGCGATCDLSGGFDRRLILFVALDLGLDLRLCSQQMSALTVTLIQSAS